MDPFLENAVFMFSCGQVKTELFENVEVTASIYYISGYALGSLGIIRERQGIMRGILLASFRLSKFEYRILNLAVSFSGRGYFQKGSLCGRRYVFIRIKEDAFSNISRYV